MDILPSTAQNVRRVSHFDIETLSLDEWHLLGYCAQLLVLFWLNMIYLMPLPPEGLLRFCL